MGDTGVRKRSSQNLTQAPAIQSAHAILILKGEYVLQKRDDKPNISSPGKWALFGGKVKSGEKPLSAIKREICEELSIEPAGFHYLWYTDYYAPFEQTIIRTWFFEADVTGVWGNHKLGEGEAIGIFKFEQLYGLNMPPVMYQTLERFHGEKELKNEN